MQEAFYMRACLEIIAEKSGKNRAAIAAIIQIEERRDSRHIYGDFCDFHLAQMEVLHLAQMEV